jgi:hypothetical protein
LRMPDYLVMKVRFIGSIPDNINRQIDGRLGTTSRLLLSGDESKRHVIGLTAGFAADAYTNPRVHSRR